MPNGGVMDDTLGLTEETKESGGKGGRKVGGWVERLV